MKTFAVILLVTLLGGLAIADDEILSREEQMSIIENYLYVTGQTSVMPLSLAESQVVKDGLPIKSGTPAIIEFMTNVDRLDKDLLLSLGLLEVERPVLELSYDSPGGQFKIHYDTAGDATVYQVDQDSDFNGIPDYVDNVALIADSVYSIIIDSLGFPAPIADTGCSTGIDSLCDIYLINQSSAYGWTQPDTACAAEDTLLGGKNLMIVPSFLTLDNDYNHISDYSSRPLDAVRVTMAHEFFHVVQFGLDWTEWDNYAWLEMSAVWMEEYIYDDINDYYAYLPYFFNTPRTSIEQALSGSDLHPYASVVFPIYLTETYGSDIIRMIWEKCADLGPAGDFLESTGWAIDSLSNHTEDFSTAFAEFALWNYFTGDRSGLAPDGIGYAERFDWVTMSPQAVFPDDAMAYHKDYPMVVRPDDNEFAPEHNGAIYIKFDETWTVEEDRFWACDSIDVLGTCHGKREILDTIAEPYDIWDSLFTALGIFYSLEYPMATDTIRYPWGLSVVYQLESDLDSFFYETIMLPSAPCLYSPKRCFQSLFTLDTYRANQFRSIMFVLTPATDNKAFYFYRGFYDLYYAIDEKGEPFGPLVEVPAAWMTPFPNPAVVPELTDDYITFHVQVNTDSTSFPVWTDPYLVVDLFNVAGDHIATLDEVSWHDPRFGEYEIRWDMTNHSGKEVASGVYMSYARLYGDDRKKTLVAEATAKVALIR